MVVTLARKYDLAFGGTEPDAVFFAVQIRILNEVVWETFRLLAEGVEAGTPVMTALAVEDRDRVVVWVCYSMSLAQEKINILRVSSFQRDFVYVHVIGRQDTKDCVRNCSRNPYCIYKGPGQGERGYAERRQK